MTQVQAARTSLTEIRHLVQGKNRELQERWEIARWMRWHAIQLSPNIKPYDKPATPKDMLRFDWEEPERVITREDCHISKETVDWLNELFNIKPQETAQS